LISRAFLFLCLTATPVGYTKGSYTKQGLGGILCSANWSRSTGRTQCRRAARLEEYAQERVFYGDIPQDDAEIIRRIGDADAVLLSHTSRIEKPVLDACPISGISDVLQPVFRIERECGYQKPPAKGHYRLWYPRLRDQGVVEYVISELVRYLHGFGQSGGRNSRWNLTGFKVGIVGLGTSGR
jgi:phosphoglycerate dehydrogenase-like enzyme